MAVHPKSGEIDNFKITSQTIILTCYSIFKDLSPNAIKCFLNIGMNDDMARASIKMQATE